MIPQIKNVVLERLLRRLEEEDIKIKYSTEDNPELPEDQFPHMSFVESDDSTYTKTLTRKGESHAVKMYSIGIYSNSEMGRQAEAERIAAIVDDEMLAMGFIRRTKIPTSNQNNATIYRISARYSGMVDKNGIIYRY